MMPATFANHLKTQMFSAVTNYFSEFESGFAAMNEGSTGKVILNWLDA